MGVPLDREAPSEQPKSTKFGANTIALATDESNQQIHTMIQETNHIVSKQNSHKGEFGIFSKIEEPLLTSLENAPDQ